MDHIFVWRSDEIGVEFINDLTSDPIVTARIATPAGTLIAMAEVEQVGRVPWLRGSHAQAARRTCSAPATCARLPAC